MRILALSAAALLASATAALAAPVSVTVAVAPELQKTFEKTYGVRLVQEREARLAALDAAIARGLMDAEDDRTVSASEVFDRLENKYQSLIQTAE